MTVKTDLTAILHDYRAGRSFVAIGRDYRCHPNTIRRRLRAAGEPALGNGRPRLVAGDEQPAQAIVE